MAVIIKHSLKNIFAKPLRLILLVICIAFASFAALLAADMKNNINDLLKGYLMDMIGSMDILVYNASEDILDGIDEIAEIRKAGISETVQYEYERDTEGYEYSIEKPITVTAISDMDVAYDMAFLPRKISLDDSSVVISREYADLLNAEVGDTISFETRDEVMIELKVAEILDISNQVMKGNSAIVTNEIIKRIACTSKTDYQCWMIDVKDDDKIPDVADALRKNDPKAELEVVSEQLDQPEIQQIYNMFYLLFLISFLLVIFVTISIAEKIVTERMSVIGTLRSLGVTQGKTAFILLIENIIYAIMGSCAGIALFNAVKPALLGGFINVEASAETGKDISQYFNDTPPAIIFAVIAGAVLVECAYPLYELLRAVKTPIRDIIFENRDTEFRFSWKRVYAGIVLAAVSLISGLLVRNFITLAVSLSFGVVALALIIPYLVKPVSGVLSRCFKKLSMPAAQLAAENISRNRMIMGTAVLCVTSITLSLLIGAVGEALTGSLDAHSGDYDLSVDVFGTDDDHSFRYIKEIEGVSESDYIYCMYVAAAINGNKKKTYNFYSDTEHTLFDEVPSESYGLADNEVVISKAEADRLRLAAGDEIKIVLSPDTDFPVEKSFVIRDIVKTDSDSMLGSSAVIISKNLYDHIFLGNLSRILLKADDPGAVREKIEKYSETSYVQAHTKDELKKQDKENSKGLLAVIRLIIAGSVALTLIGVAGNQSLGFISRKRETALLCSVAMSRSGMKRLIFLESFFAMSISALTAGLVSPFLYRVLAHLLDLITEGDIGILSTGGPDSGRMLAYIAVIFAVFLMTVLIPYKYLRKMNIAEELKYE